MSNGLKPCPFCGSEAERKEHCKYRKGYKATVGCKSLCPAEITQATLNGGFEEAYRNAENVWNERLYKEDKNV